MSINHGNSRGGSAGEKQHLVVANSKDIQRAYATGDAEASRLLHDARAGQAHEEDHSNSGEYLKSMIFGGLDGILTSFAIVAGAAGGNLEIEAVLILGFSNIFADAMSMGVGEYLSSKAHNEYVLAEKRREEWELKNHKEGEIQEMIEIYTERGMSREDAEDVIGKMAKYDDLFVNLMMNEELGLQVPSEDEDQTIKEGFIMFLSFAGFGAMPLLGYIVFPFFDPDLTANALFALACAVTATSLFVMGAVKSQFGTRSWYCSGIEMLLLGGSCAFVAYEIGSIVEGVL
ncbi:unnamed protein product [Phaeothamnion confervicola]